MLYLLKVGKKMNEKNEVTITFDINTSVTVQNNENLSKTYNICIFILMKIIVSYGESKAFETKRQAGCTK